MKKITNRLWAALLGASALLLCIGNVMIVHAAQATHTRTTILYIITGIVIALITILCGNKRLLKAAPFLGAALLILLVLCLLTGYPVNGAYRWLKIAGFTVAPSLLAMPIVSIFWTYVIQKEPFGSSVKKEILLCAATAATAGLILAEPFVSMAGFIAILGWTLYAITSRNRKKMLIAAAVFLIAAVSLLPVFSHGSVPDFYSNLFQPDRQTQYHTWSLLTTLKHSVFCGANQIPEEIQLHIPNAINDAALIAGCGAFGYLFLITALLLTAIIIAAGISAYLRSSDQKDRLLSAGMTCSLALPALVNTLMMFGLLPMGGTAFPFLSYGGTVMIANMLALGCITNTLLANGCPPKC